MSFHLTLQSAPERRGEVGDPSAWEGGGVSTVTSYGTYTGDKTKTFTFTVDGGGTIGTTETMEVDWDDGEGNTGTLHIGTDHDYSAGDVLYVNEGVSVSFGAGAVTDTATFTIDVVAINRLRHDHQIVDGDADPVDVAIQLLTFSDLDLLQTSYAGTSSRTERAILRTPAVTLDYQDSDARYAMLHMAHERHETTLSENYSDSTVLCFRGGSADKDADGLLPVVGTYATFTRSGIATYQDPHTGLWRTVASGVPRYQYGPETASRDSTNNYERLLDGRANHTGHAITVSKAATNVDTWFHPNEYLSTWTTSVGSPSITVDTEHPGIIDTTDSGWSLGDALKVSARVDFLAGEAVESLSTSTVSGSTDYACQVWVKGRGGSFVFYLMAGNGAASTSRGTTSHSVFSEDEWVRVYWTGTTGASDNVAKIKIQAVGDDAVLYISARQIEEGEQCTGIIQTAGVANTRNVETLKIDDQIPPAAGTVAAWVHWGGDYHSDSPSLYSIVEANGGDLFRLGYDGNDRLKLQTASAGALTSNVDNWKFYTWRHIAATWEVASATTVTRKLYYDGSLVGTSTSTNAIDSAWGDEIQLFKPAAGCGAPSECRIFDLRVESRALSADEIEDCYNRVADSSWRHIISETYGRRFWLSDVQEYWLHTSNPDKMLLGAQLTESGRERSSLVVRS